MCVTTTKEKTTETVSVGTLRRIVTGGSYGTLESPFDKTYERHRLCYPGFLPRGGTG